MSRRMMQGLKLLMMSRCCEMDEEASVHEPSWRSRANKTVRPGLLTLLQCWRPLQRQSTVSLQGMAKEDIMPTGAAGACRTKVLGEKEERGP